MRCSLNKYFRNWRFSAKIWLEIPSFEIQQTCERRRKPMKNILVVEDSPRNLNLAMQALRGKVNPVPAMSLNEAMAIIEGGGIDGVITDICFQETGVSVREQFIDKTAYESNPSLAMANEVSRQDEEPLDEKVLNLFDSHLQNSEFVVSQDFGKKVVVYCLGNTSEILRSEIIAASLACGNPLMGCNGCSPNDLRDFNSSNCQSLIPPAAVPALGYILMKLCLERMIPVVFISSTRHANHAFVAPIAAGLITSQELIDAFAKATKSTCGVDVRTSKGIFVGDYEKSEEHWNFCLEILSPEYGSKPSNKRTLAIGQTLLERTIDQLMVKVSPARPRMEAEAKTLYTNDQTGTVVFNVLTDNNTLPHQPTEHIVWGTFLIGNEKGYFESDSYVASEACFSIGEISETDDAITVRRRGTKTVHFGLQIPVGDIVVKKSDLKPY